MHQPSEFGKALPVRVSHSFAAASALFEQENLASCAGLVPLMTLAPQNGLGDLLARNVHIAEPRIKSGSANLSPKLCTRRDRCMRSWSGIHGGSAISRFTREVDAGRRLTVRSPVHGSRVSNLLKYRASPSSHEQTVPRAGQCAAS
jgi:hypothetical protein